jgi:hypothetical protein
MRQLSSKKYKNRLNVSPEAGYSFSIKVYKSYVEKLALTNSLVDLVSFFRLFNFVACIFFYGVLFYKNDFLLGTTSYNMLLSHYSVLCLLLSFFLFFRVWFF